MATIKGQNLRILISDTVSGTKKCVAASTSCTCHLAAQVEDSSTKDSENAWAENEVVGFNWDISVDALVTLDPDSEDTDARRVDDLVVGNTYFVTFAQTQGEAGEMNRDAVSNALQLTGKAILSDLSIIAANRQNSTFTASFTGTGELEQYDDNASS